MRDKVGVRRNREDAQSMGVARPREWKGFIVSRHGDPQSRTPTNPSQRKNNGYDSILPIRVELGDASRLVLDVLPGNKTPNSKVCVYG